MKSFLINQKTPVTMKLPAILVSLIAAEIVSASPVLTARGYDYWDMPTSLALSDSITNMLKIVNDVASNAYSKSSVERSSLTWAYLCPMTGSLKDSVDDLEDYIKEGLKKEAISASLKSNLQAMVNQADTFTSGMQQHSIQCNKVDGLAEKVDQIKRLIDTKGTTSTASKNDDTDDDDDSDLDKRADNTESDTDSDDDGNFTDGNETDGDMTDEPGRNSRQKRANDDDSDSDDDTDGNVTDGYRTDGQRNSHHKRANTDTDDDDDYDTDGYQTDRYNVNSNNGKSNGNSNNANGNRNSANSNSNNANGNRQSGYYTDNDGYDTDRRSGNRKVGKRELPHFVDADEVEFAKRADNDNLDLLPDAIAKALKGLQDSASKHYNDKNLNRDKYDDAFLCEFTDELKDATKKLYQQGRGGKYASNNQKIKDAVNSWVKDAKAKNVDCTSDLDSLKSYADKLL